jgi:hypothetical protein
VEETSETNGHNMPFLWQDGIKITLCYFEDDPTEICPVSDSVSMVDILNLVNKSHRTTRAPVDRPISSLASGSGDGLSQSAPSTPRLRFKCKMPMLNMSSEV